MEYTSGQSFELLNENLQVLILFKHSYGPNYCNLDVNQYNHHSHDDFIHHMKVLLVSGGLFFYHCLNNEYTSSLAGLLQ